MVAVADRRFAVSGSDQPWTNPQLDPLLLYNDSDFKIDGGGATTGGETMSRWLVEGLPELAARVAVSRSLLLFADFDGTLSPFEDLPEKAQLLPGMKDVLLRLLERKGLVLSIISGRNLLDLAPRVGIPGLIYAGNHGLEIRGPHFSFVEPRAAAQRPALSALVADLVARLQSVEGVLVEDRGLSACVHYRLVAESQREFVHQAVQAATAAAAGKFLVTRGVLLHDIRSDVPGNKGTAVRWIRERMRLNNALAIYLGDDCSDEDAFTVLPDAITIRVGGPTQTAARYYLPGPAEVRDFLAWLADQQNIRPFARSVRQHS